MAGYSQTWHELRCPDCSAINFVNAGDMQDMTGFDPESCKCWKCGCCFDFEGNPGQEEEFCDDGVHFEEVDAKRKKK